MNNKSCIYRKYFEEKILKQVEPIEKERRKMIRRAVLSSLFCFLCGIILAVILVIIDFDNIYRIFLFPPVLFLMYAFIIKGIINFIVVGKEYQQMLYEKVLPLFLPPVANFKPWPKNGNTEAIIESNLFGNFDTQEDVSSFFGFYNKTNITISDTRLTLPVKGVNKPNLFKGTVIELELEKSIENHVVVFSKNERRYNHFKQINPHIDEMNKFVYVFARNKRNLDFITEEFWQKIKAFGEIYTAKGFEFSYNCNTIIIAIRQKRPMLFGFLFKSLLKAENYDDLIKRFIAIFDLVDLLNKS